MRLGLISLAMCALGWGGSANATPSAELRRFFDAEWEWQRKDSPEEATQLGDHRYDDRWSDFSPEAFVARRAHALERLAKARAFEKRKLDEQDRLSLAVFMAQATYEVDLDRFPLERLAISQLQGPQAELPQLAQQPIFRTPRERANWVKRLHALPRYIEQTIALLEEGRQSGWLAAREPLRDVPKAIRALHTAKAEDSVFYAPFKDVADPSATEATQAISTEVGPALDKLATYVEETYMPATRKDVGVWSLPEGAAYYEAAIREHTTLRKSADEIHALGLAEVERLDRELEKTMRATGFKGTREEFAKMLRTDARFFYKDGSSLLTGYRDICKRIDGRLPQLFRTLPRLPYGVEPVPANEAPVQTTAYYMPGAPEDARSGTFMANLYKVDTRPKWEMEALALHESVPGHHLQMALAQEMGALPRFRREAGFTAFVEGWGLYAESLGPELGMFKDPYAKYGQLTYEMWRAVRLVVDTGMHAKRWTRQQAIDYFMQHSAKTQHDIEVEVDRYIVWPGQALAYKLGELEIKRLRAMATNELGDKFDIRAFHDVVLGAGALPLELVDRRVEAWLRATK